MSRFWKVAHRGWHKIHVENSLDAFRAAYAAGCYMVEFDVQLSRDGIPVVLHDDDCQRLAGRREKVYDLTWKELQAMPLRGKPLEGGLAHYYIPSLEQFLGEFGNAPFYLELKIPRGLEGNQGYVEMLADKCAAMVTAANPHPDTFLASFHGGILKYLAQSDVFPILGGIFENYPRFLDVYTGKDSTTAAAIQHFSVSWDIFRRYFRENKGSADLFLVWDIDGEKDFRTAMAHGVLGLVADDVETLCRLEQAEKGSP